MSTALISITPSLLYLFHPSRISLSRGGLDDDEHGISFFVTTLVKHPESASKLDIDMHGNWDCPLRIVVIYRFLCFTWKSIKKGYKSLGLGFAIVLQRALGVLLPPWLNLHAS